MKILLISPLGFPINEQSRYTGIERLVWEYSKELVKEHDITVLGHALSVFPEGVKVLPFPKNDELKAYQSYQYLLRTFDVIHDFSHLHLASRFNTNLPSVSLFWHAPSLAKYPKSPYNIIAPSRWGEREFERVYRQKARYQQSIVIDPEVYFPLAPVRPEIPYAPPSMRNMGKRNDRFLTIGRMAPEKGNLNALMLCQEANVPLDVVGGRGAERGVNEPLTDYEQAIQALCDGEQIKFWGEITEEEKINLMQTCRGLIYATNHPEVTNHKVQECLFCGAPVIVPTIGAMPEIVTHGVDGFLCSTDAEYSKAITEIDTLCLETTHKAILATYSVSGVVRDYLLLYEEVAGGLRW